MPEYEIVKHSAGMGITVWADRSNIKALIDAGIGDPSAFIDRHSSSIIDDVSKSKITSLSVDIKGKTFRIAAKEYLPRGSSAAFKDFFRPSKARVELLLSARLADLGVPVPEPVAAVEIRSFRLLKKAYLFNQEIYGGSSLLEFLDSQNHTGLGRRQLNRIIEALSSVVAGAHEKGLFHGDLNASHLVLRSWKENNPEAFILDFENSKIKKVVGISERMRDLARLERSASYFLSIRERLRFLRHYIKLTNPGRHLRDWVNDIRTEVERRTK